MAGNKTSFKRGNQAAVKHGAFARSRLAEQTAAVQDARKAMMAGELTPMMDSLMKAFTLTGQQIDDVRAWLDKNGGPLTPHGKVKAAAAHLDRLLVHYSTQAATIYRLKQATNPDIQKMSREQAQQFLGDRYRSSTPEGVPPAEAGTAPRRAASGTSPAPA